MRQKNESKIFIEDFKLMKSLMQCIFDALGKKYMLH